MTLLKCSADLTIRVVADLIEAVKVNWYSREGDYYLGIKIGSLKKMVNILYLLKS